MAEKSGLFHFHHDLERSDHTNVQTDLAVEHTGILDVLGLQLDLLLIDGCACQLSQSIGNFLAGDFAVPISITSKLCPIKQRKNISEC